MAIERHGDARVIRHALAQDALTTLRDVETDGVAFRDALVRLGRVCGGELADDVLGTETVEVETPLTTTTGERVASDVVVVTVLRAAVPFVEGMLTALPDARQGMLSASRDETAGMDGGTFPIDVAYENLPAIGPTDTVVVADPMLATGSTMCAALERVHAAGDPARVLALAAVSAPEGVARVTDEFPETDVVTAAVDDGLNSEGFIVPGLGDAGDRAFRTT
ncbi:uracil phosphoribosyltransferase [Halorientalis litorea]|uniref:uracil phosphoribosyltransferase n=1 Tax=Halorientalis litorea TaxID=2931977 RepID=UPI001FF3ADE3|nr:uracil phosphoribosyltransferase [Halorientalis litorea]